MDPDAGWQMANQSTKIAEGWVCKGTEWEEVNFKHLTRLFLDAPVIPTNTPTYFKRQFSGFVWYLKTLTYGIATSSKSKELRHKRIKEHLSSINLIPHVPFYEPSGKPIKSPPSALKTCPAIGGQRQTMTNHLLYLESVSVSRRHWGICLHLLLYVRMTSCHFWLAGGPLSVMIYWFSSLLLLAWLLVLSLAAVVSPLIIARRKGGANSCSRQSGKNKSKRGRAEKRRRVDGTTELHFPVDSSPVMKNFSRVLELVAICYSCR